MGELAIEPDGRLDDLEAVAPRGDVDTASSWRSDECYASHLEHWAEDDSRIRSGACSRCTRVRNARIWLVFARAFTPADAAIVSYLAQRAPATRD